MFKTLKEKLGFIKKKAKDLDEEFTTGLGKKLTEDKIEDFLWDIEIALMEADVAVDVIEKIKDDIKKKLVGKKILQFFSCVHRYRSLLFEEIITLREK